jgi:xanthine dehydrogenase YagR molybdenum-binding subunit
MAVQLAAVSQGKPITRVDGRQKVTGAAKYPAEFQVPEAAYGYLVLSEIAKGRIISIDTSAAEKAAGVIVVLTHLNAPKFSEPVNASRAQGIRIEERLPFSDAVISYGGQYVAMVVAEKFEQARYAASLVHVAYLSEKHALIKDDAAATAVQPPENQGQKIQVTKGDPASALQNPNFVSIDQVYSTPTETHNPMECSATIAQWEGAERLRVYDATQYVKGAQSVLARIFGLQPENVRVTCPFVGGAFGCKGPVWPHTILAVMAARAAGRPVRLELTRQQMFSGTGHRSPTVQRVAIAASRDGKVQAIRQQSETVTSPVGRFIEVCGIGGANVLYDAPNIEFRHTLYTVNVAQPSFMRAPGECPGTYAMECAMDELAYALKMDPLKLRLINDSPNHPIKGVPWSARHLRECFQRGAERFGWSRRNPEPRSMHKDNKLLGWGVATATYPANKWVANANIEIDQNGIATVRCATHDLGTGAYTAMSQISADAIGIPVEQVKFELGDSDLPFGPVAGGSNSTATVGSAIVDTAKKLHAKLAELAVKDSKSPLYGVNPSDVRLIATGKLGVNSDRADSILGIIQRAGVPSVAADGGIQEEKNDKLAFQSFGAQFCEVMVDPDLASIRVSRFVSVMNCGRIINPKTAGNQIVGGIVIGIGMALEEETHYDPTTGLPVTRNLADYHVPVNADIPAIEVQFVEEPDFAFNPMGSRGLGEIGNTGTAATVANAVFHATGRRVRDLPITLDKIL